MKRALATLVLFASVLAGPAAKADDVCPAPRCLDVVVPAPAGLIVPDSTCV